VNKTRTDKKVGYTPRSKVLLDKSVNEASTIETSTTIETEAETEKRCTPEAAEAALKLLEGRWKMVIIFRLFAQPVLRFSELERVIPAVSQKMLIQQLRELERDGIVQRTIYPQVPPKVEYSLTDLGRALYPALDALLKWASLRGDTGE
jgi:DNA-binding HxlR family transcriptional regulator